MLSLKQELESRGLLKQYTDEKLFDLYDQGGQKFYFGMDPTADSLHLGNFVNFMNAVHLMRRGNTCIPLVGGATGMIGDPGGKDAERSFLDEATLAHNVTSIQNQINTLISNIKSVLGEELPTQPVVNNKDFYNGMSFLDFLREAGKYITVNSMLTKETVKKRIEDPDKSISYTEFSYMLIQGYDFYKLYADQGVKLQIAGSDQWGNVTTGTEIIRKKTDGGEAYAFTCPLVLDSNGKKFGKSEGNAIWLDKNKTSPTQMYQYFIKVQDTDVERFLKLFTFLSEEEISSLITEHNKNPELRIGQKRLAYLVVEIIHGTKDVDVAQLCSDIMYGDDKIIKLRNASYDEIFKLFFELGGYKLNEDDITYFYDGNKINYEKTWSNSEFKIDIYDLLIKSGLSKSRGDAKNLVLGGGIYWNNEKISPNNILINSVFDYETTSNHCLGILTKGKTHKLILRSFSSDI